MSHFVERQRLLEESFDFFNKLRDPQQRSWILLNPTSLGDTMVVCALTKAFREKHGGTITMVVSQEQVPLAQMYKQSITRIAATSFQQVQWLSGQLAEHQVFAMDQPWVVHPFWHGDGRFEHLVDLFRYKKRGGLAFCDVFRHLMRVGWDAPLELPVIPEEWKQEAKVFAEAAGIVPGKSVILFPDNNSVPGFPASFWETLVEELNKLDYKVFTNMAGNRAGPRTEPFRGSHGIKVPLNLAISLVEIAGRYIAGNNGLINMFVLAQAKTTGTVLLHNKPFTLNGFIAEHPLPHQSMRYMGFVDVLPTTEYLVNPDNIPYSLIVAIAANDPKSALLDW